MGYKCSDYGRDTEIVVMFHTVLNLRLEEGKDYSEAKNEAFDAIELRFQLSKKRCGSILSQHIRDNPDTMYTRFLSDNQDLIRCLSEVNIFWEKEMKCYEEIQKGGEIKEVALAEKCLSNYRQRRDHNTKLIKLLEEVNVRYSDKCKKPK